MHCTAASNVILAWISTNAVEHKEVRAAAHDLQSTVGASVTHGEVQGEGGGGGGGLAIEEYLNRAHDVNVMRW
jgi:hypothetical protein